MQSGPPNTEPAVPHAPKGAAVRSGRAGLGLLGVFALQLICALFFVGESVADLAGYNETVGVIDTDTFEYIVTMALMFGVVVTGLEIRKMLSRQARIEQQLQIASGAFVQLLDEQFAAWKLTPSERDVALLAIKGLSNAEMAAIRNTKDGTIKAQCNAVYRKAGVTGRPQLLSLFIEALLDENLLDRPIGGRRTADTEGAPGRSPHDKSPP